MNTRSVRLLCGTLFALALAVVLIVTPGPAHSAPAAVFFVDSPGDVADAVPGDGFCDTGGGVCTLRAAIMEANKTSGATINFGLTPPVTYTLSLGRLVISSTMNIVGVGPSGTIIDGNGGVTNDRVIEVITKAVSISGITITDGKPSALNALGGGILQDSGALTLTNVSVSGNEAHSTSGAAYGGGIYASGRLVLINSGVINNKATTASGLASGGGIVGGFGITLTNSTVSGNSARDNGGGLYGGGTIIDSTISDNTATNGGGIWGGSLTMMNSTISGNLAYDNGGGMYHTSGTANMFNVTIANNQANSDSSGSGFGGGIANSSGAINLQNSIVGDNTNVLVINMQPVLNPEDCSGTLTSLGYNIISETTDCTFVGAIVTNPLLDTLGNYGGVTRTHNLLAGSPAIDAGNPGGCTDTLGAIITTDQRGLHRPAFGGTALRCDIGAVEYYAKSLFLPLILK